MLRHFQASDGIQGVVKMNDVLDGLTNTLMIGEISWTPTDGAQTHFYRSWVRGNIPGANGGAGAAKNMPNLARVINSNQGFNPAINNFNDISFGSNHTGGAVFVYGDGSVKFVNQEVDTLILQRMSTIARKELANITD
jgi:hypothetical protein